MVDLFKLLFAHDITYGVANFSLLDWLVGISANQYIHNDL